MDTHHFPFYLLTFLQRREYGLAVVIFCFWSPYRIAIYNSKELRVFSFEIPNGLLILWAINGRIEEFSTIVARECLY